jgi:integrase
MTARRTRITEATLKGLKPAPAGKRAYVWDTVLQGFGVMTMDTGASSFIAYARYGGSRSPSRRKIGAVGRMGLADARAAGRELLEAARQGRDPKAEEKAARLAKEGRKTFGELVEIFIARHVAKQRKARDVEREIRKELLPKLNDRPIEEITRKEIAALIGEIRDRPAPRHAHNVFGHLRRFYSWLLAQPEYDELIPASPCDRIRAKDLIGEKHSRQRVLNDREVAAVWKATEKLADPWRSFYRLLILTGARKSEVSDVKWSEFDLAGEKPLWTIPPARFKSDKVHLVPLSSTAVELLEQLPRGDRGDFVFSTRRGKIPIDGFSKSKVKLDALVAAELGVEPEPWQVHDIRRSVRTQLSKLRIPTEVSELVIGHTLPTLHKIYDQHAYLDERREALEKWAACLRSIVEPPPENLTNFEDARRVRV